MRSEIAPGTTENGVAVGDWDAPTTLENQLAAAGLMPDLGSLGAQISAASLRSLALGNNHTLYGAY